MFVFEVINRLHRVTFPLPSIFGCIYAISIAEEKYRKYKNEKCSFLKVY